MSDPITGQPASQPNWPPPSDPGQSAWPTSPAPTAPNAQFAGWGARFGAVLIDGIITAIPIFLVVVVFLGSLDGDEITTNAAGDQINVDEGSAIGLGLGILISYVIAFLYPALTMMRKGSHNGQTFGKQMVGIRVVRDSGRPMGFWYSGLREWIVKGFLSPFTLGIDYLWPLWDAKNQSLHDKVVGTYVVKR